MKKSIGCATLIAFASACGAQGLDLGEDRAAALGNEDAGPVASSDESANDSVPNLAPTEDNANSVGGQNPVPSPFGESNAPESDEPPAPVGNLDPASDTPVLANPQPSPQPGPALTADVAPCPPVQNDVPTAPVAPTPNTSSPSPSSTSSNGVPVNTDPPDPCHPLPEAGPMGPQPAPSNSTAVPAPMNPNPTGPSPAEPVPVSPGPTMVPTPEDPGICDSFTSCEADADCGSSLEYCLGGYCFPEERPNCGGAAGWTCEGDPFTECVIVVGDAGVCMAEDEVECFTTRSGEGGESE